MTAKTQDKMVCPHCGMELNIDDLYMSEYQKKFENEFQKKIQDALAHQHEEAQKDLEARTKEAEERARSEQALQIQELTNKIQILTEANEKAGEKLFEFQKQQFELQQNVRDAKAEAQEEFNKKAAELYRNAQEKAKQDADDEINKLKKQLSDANKATEEIQKKLEQGSQQLQGEVQELMLEESLRAEFPFDVIEEVEKGKNGADVIQSVYDRLGRYCGRIVWESKNVRTWKNEFIPKLNEDLRRANGDVGILVTRVLGKNMAEFTQKDGVWLVSPSNAMSMARLVRQMIVSVADTRNLVERQETLQERMYEFITGPVFRNRIENIGRQYRELDVELNSARDSMNRHFDKQRALIDQLVSNNEGILGDVGAFMLGAGEKETEAKE